MEFSGTFLNQNDGVNLPNILIGKCLVLGALLFSHLGVLTHDQERTILCETLGFIGQYTQDF